MATFLRTRVIYVSGGVQCLLTHYWDSAGGTQSAIITEALARVRSMFNQVAAFYPATAAITYVTVGDFIEETTGELQGQATGTAPSAITATGTGDFLPQQTQGLMRYYTGAFFGGRQVRGRTYLPNPLESSNDASGVPSAAYRTAWQAGADRLGTTIVTPISQRVWRRPRPGVPGLSYPVTARDIAPTWSIQRSRRT